MHTENSERGWQYEHPTESCGERERRERSREFYFHKDASKSARTSEERRYHQEEARRIFHED